MTSNKLPKFIQPLHMAERGVLLQGQLSLQQLSRLQDLLVNSTGEVQINWQLGIDDNGFAYIRGNLDTVLPLRCQRCWGTMMYPLHLMVSLSPILGEASVKKLPEQYEPLVLTEDQVTVADVIEEEILLALPLAAKHEDEGCASPSEPRP